MLFGCGELAPIEAPPVTWTNGAGAVFAECSECHEQTSSFFELARSCREDGEHWISPGDETSAVLEVLSGGEHRARISDAALEQARSWITGELTFVSKRAHPAGWSLDHGRPLDPRPCATCHSETKELGGAIPCTSCHLEAFRVDRCNNCHDHRDDRCASPVQRTSARLHRVHASGGSDGSFPAASCESCHRVPRNILERGHFNDGSERAETLFDTTGCNVPACHAARTPIWAEPSAERCERCHGNPPEDHASDRCDDCHRGATHLDRALNIGVACNECHATERLGGAHAAHLSASVFREAIACESCHLVPVAREAAGHIDTAPPAEVLFFGAAATAEETLFPRFDGQRCANVGCHGAHLDGGAEHTDLWTSRSTPACGSCHALPPVFVRNGASTHLPTGAADCGICHRTPSGDPISLGSTLITEAGKRVHADGHVDVEDGL